MADPYGLGDLGGLDPDALMGMDPAQADPMLMGAGAPAAPAMPQIPGYDPAALVPDKPVGLAELGVLALPAIVGALGKFGGGNQRGGAMGAIVGAGLGAKQIQKDRADEFTREKFAEQAKLAREKARADAAYRAEMMDHARAQSELWRTQAAGLKDKNAMLKASEPGMRDSVEIMLKHSGYDAAEAATIAKGYGPEELQKLSEKAIGSAASNSRYVKGEMFKVGDKYVQQLVNTRNPADTVVVPAPAGAVPASVADRKDTGEKGALSEQQRMAAYEKAATIVRGDPDMLEEIDKESTPEAKEAARDDLIEREASKILAHSKGETKPDASAKTANKPLASVDSKKYDTALSPEEETKFQEWKAKYAPHDSGEDYDLRGAYKAGIKPVEGQHGPDTFKKPNHPTFSNESIYAKDRPDLAGRWEDGTYVPPAGVTLTAERRAAIARAGDKVRESTDAPISQLGTVTLKDGRKARARREANGTYTLIE